MRTALTISGVAHATLLAWGMLAFVARPYTADSVEAMPVDIISNADFTKLTAGAKNAPKIESPKPVAETIGEPTPVEDPAAKVGKKDITASTDKPPLPEPKPPLPEQKKQAEAKSDPIAEALKKDEARKPEPKKAEVKPPMPPKRPAQAQQPKFDPRKVEALLDKRDPQRLAAAGEVVNSTVGLGAVRGDAPQISQTELDALRARLSQCWSPPAGAAEVERLKVVIRVLFNQDGTVARPPELVAGTPSPFGPAMAESAKRAILRCQPFDMLKQEHYDQWKDIEITFDPRDMIRG